MWCVCGKIGFSALHSFTANPCWNSIYQQEKFGSFQSVRHLSCELMQPSFIPWHLAHLNACHAGTTPGQDLNLSLDRVTSNRNFTNKLWNAAKFILLNLEDLSEAEWAELQTVEFSAADRIEGLPLPEAWILSLLHQVLHIVPISLSPSLRLTSNLFMSKEIGILGLTAQLQRHQG